MEIACDGAGPVGAGPGWEYVRTVRSSVIRTEALQKVGQIARVIPMLENVEAERSATQRDKSLNDPARPLCASTQAVANRFQPTPPNTRERPRKLRAESLAYERDNKQHGPYCKNHSREKV